MIVMLAANANAAVFQYAVPVQTSRGERMAFLWIPPKAKQVRGVIMAGMTLMEREFAKDSRIREACADEQLAIVFLKCGLRAANLQSVLDDLAKSSGYRELSIAPLMFVGHSAGGPQAAEAARKMSDRCFGLVQYRGGNPGGETPIPPGIPALMMIGQFDEFGKIGRAASGFENWEYARDRMIAFRSQNENNLGSIVVEPGAGHFDWSKRNADYLALFLGKAARARIPASWPVDAKRPIKLNVIDPTSGWLTDLTIANTTKQKTDAPSMIRKASPYERYKGDRKKTAWHFDEEMANATVAYHKGIRKKDQFLTWKDPHRVDAGARFFFQRIKWIGDGQSFRVHPTYAKSYPSQFNGRGSKWAEAGNPVGHSSALIRIKMVGGPIVATGPDTFRIQFDALASATENGRITFMAYSDGDKTYRYTERVGMLPRDSGKRTNGKAQTITFPPIGNLKADNYPVKLKATSDSGLPVAYYIAYGPAKIVNGNMLISEVPARAKFPIAVKVVAYQFGRAVEPFVQTAEPVERTIMINRNSGISNTK